jgi:hypothetical protein
VNFALVILAGAFFVGMEVRMQAPRRDLRNN